MREPGPAPVRVEKILAIDEVHHAALLGFPRHFGVQARRRQQGVLSRGIQIENAREPGLQAGVIQILVGDLGSRLVIERLQCSIRIFARAIGSPRLASRSSEVDGGSVRSWALASGSGARACRPICKARPTASRASTGVDT